MDLLKKAELAKLKAVRDAGQLTSSQRLRLNALKALKREEQRSRRAGGGKVRAAPTELQHRMRGGTASAGGAADDGRGAGESPTVSLRELRRMDSEDTTESTGLDVARDSSQRNRAAGAQRSLRWCLCAAPPPVPPLPVIGSMTTSQDRMQFFGPTANSNWVVPDRLLVGGFPGTEAGTDLALHERQLQALLSAGVDTMVCLQEKLELWSRFYPYPKTMKGMAVKAGKTKFECLHLEMPDGDVADDSDVRCCVETILKRIRKGRLVYVHCRGGHGRAGTIVCTAISRLYAMHPQAAIRYFNTVETIRLVKDHVNPWPHSQQQKDLVTRLGAEPAGSGKGCGGKMNALEEWSSDF